MHKLTMILAEALVLLAVGCGMGYGPELSSQSTQQVEVTLDEAYMERYADFSEYASRSQVLMEAQIFEAFRGSVTQMDDLHWELEGNVVSEPRLLTDEFATANIRMSVEPVSAEATDPRRFRPVSYELEVIPEILSNNMVSLLIEFEVVGLDSVTGEGSAMLVQSHESLELGQAAMVRLPIVNDEYEWVVFVRPVAAAP